MKTTHYRYFRIGIALLVATLLSACSSIPRKEALNSTQLQTASINGFSNIRYIPSTKLGTEAFLNELKVVIPKRGADPNRVSNFLSLSGGGDNGAFGAGLLLGWTKQGSRPDFDQVVGISTGALIAPLAYLGSSYDNVLRDVFTSVTPKDIYKERGTLGLLFHDAMADNAPLAALIEKNVTVEMLDDIAHLYQTKGRLLLIGTTNIDTGQIVLWNMGKLASYKTPASAKLFRQIMLASAAIPGAFPPALFEAMVEEKEFDELHVDGGLAVQIYLYPGAVTKAALAQGVMKPIKRNSYIIRNAKISIDQSKTERNGLSIVDRSLKKMIQAQGVGNLYQIYEIARRDNISFNLAFIGDDFSYPHPNEFDQAYMKALFNYGYQKALTGYPWNTSPPGLDQSTEEDIKAQSKQIRK
mgnify:CR=1 FL=1|jgi:predicted acylesterase/phospholipase RssA